MQSKSLMSKPINLIVACAENRVIGRAGRLPFHIPEDQAWFHEKTAGTTVVLGRICFETWPAALADGRTPVVISRDAARIRAAAARKPGQPTAAAPDVSAVRVAPDVPSALAVAKELPGEIMVCGGQRIYEETLPLCDRLLLTLVHAEVEGDTWFPEWRDLAWRESWRRESTGAGFRYTFSVLERVR